MKKAIYLLLCVIVLQGAIVFYLLYQQSRSFNDYIFHEIIFLIHFSKELPKEHQKEAIAPILKSNFVALDKRRFYTVYNQSHTSFCYLLDNTDVFFGPEVQMKNTLTAQLKHFMARNKIDCSKDPYEKLDALHPLFRKEKE